MEKHRSVRYLGIAWFLAWRFLPILDAGAVTVGKTYTGRCAKFHVEQDAAINPELKDRLHSACACRWDYRALGKLWDCETARVKRILRDECEVVVQNLGNGLEVPCIPCDWGPNPRTGRLVDLTQKAMSMLLLETDQTVTLTLIRRPKQTRRLNPIQEAVK